MEKIRIIEKENQPLMVDIGPVPDWEGFDKLVQYIKNEFMVSIIKSVDGPGSRRWIFDCNGQEFELIHDDGFGNYLLAPKKNSENVVRLIAKDLLSRFDN